jgi:ABC-type nitrate/sulfonate/bicarbonate transport system permease component
MAPAGLTAMAGAKIGLSGPKRLQIAALIGFVAAWEIISAVGLVYRGVIPSWLAIGTALFNLLATGPFWSNLAVTLTEIGLALLIGSTAGCLAGLLIGSNRLVAAAVEPLINCVASTPKVVFLPLLYLAFGIGVGSKIAAGSLSCFFPMVIGVTAGMLHINPVYVRVGRSYGLTSLQMAQKVYLPSLMEPIANGLRIAIGVAISVCLIAETRFSYAGLGHMVIDSFNRSRFAQVYAVLVIIIGLAVTLNALVGRVARR